MRVSVVITVRVPLELKRELDRLGVNISEVVRRALREEVIRRKLDELRRLQEIARRALRRVGVEEIVRAVRETRDES